MLATSILSRQDKIEHAKAAMVNFKAVMQETPEYREGAAKLLDFAERVLDSLVTGRSLNLEGLE